MSTVVLRDFTDPALNTRPQDAIAREAWSQKDEPSDAVRHFARRACKTYWRGATGAGGVGGAGVAGVTIETAASAQFPGTVNQAAAGGAFGYALQVVDVSGRPFQSLAAAEQVDGRLTDWTGVVYVPNDLTIALLGGATQTLTNIDGTALTAGQRAYRFITGLGVNHGVGRDYAAIRGFLVFSVAGTAGSIGIREVWGQLMADPLPAMDFFLLRLNMT